MDVPATEGVTEHWHLGNHDDLLRPMSGGSSKIITAGCHDK